MTKREKELLKEIDSLKDEVEALQAKIDNLIDINKNLAYDIDDLEFANDELTELLQASGIDVEGDESRLDN